MKKDLRPWNETCQMSNVSKVVEIIGSDIKTNDSDRLHDGIKDVKHIAVYLLVRNNEEYLEYLFKSLATFEKVYTCNFSYYIYENDSSDKTVDLCQQFMQGRNGRFWTENLKTKFVNDGTSFERVQRIAQARNRLLSLCRSELVAADWCLFIDSDIIFEHETLQKMFAHRPAAQNIAMMTCKTIRIMPRTGMDIDVPQPVKFITENHYYDTFAYVRLDDVMPYPLCCSKECTNKTCQYLREDWCESDNMFDEVRSAWAGFVLIASEAFANPAVEWKTIKIMNGKSLCEHLYLCDMIRCVTQKKIVKLNDVVLFHKMNL